MDRPVITSGSVTAGKLKVRHSERVTAELQRWRGPGPFEVVITIERRRAVRSLAQNAWYHGQIIDPIAEHCGYTHDEAHELMKALHLPKELAVEGRNGLLVEGYIIGGSTRKLNKLEFGEYCERVRAWALEKLDVLIPDPDVHD
jgi:hypothetical protein